MAFALADSGVSRLTIHNRTMAKAESLAAQIKAAYPGCDARAGSANAAGHDIVVNATSLGLKPDDGFSFDPMTADTRRCSPR